MNEPKRKRRRTKRTYRYHKNAVCLSVFDPTGATIPAPVRKALENVVWEIAREHQLLINIADE